MVGSTDFKTRGRRMYYSPVRQWVDNYASKYTRVADEMQAQNEACVEWPFARKPFGYGEIGFEGHCHNAHRYVWEKINGPITNGLHVLHRCDNPPCVNVNHLFLGTHAENIQDAKAKGRLHPRGRALRKEVRRLAAEGLPRRTIAALSGASKGVLDSELGKMSPLDRLLRICYANDLRNKGYRLWTIAQRLGVDQSAVSLWASGKRGQNLIERVTRGR